MTQTAWDRQPGIWRAIPWALAAPHAGGVSRQRLALRALWATLAYPQVMRRWMAMVFELHSRGLTPDLPAQYLRAIRPSVHRRTSISTRASQLIDHADWLEGALQPAAFAQIGAGGVLILAGLAPPRGYETMRLQLQRAAHHSPEGELLLTLTLQRSVQKRPNALPVDAAVLAFSRFRIDGVACMAIGGVRGQRNQEGRISARELGQVLQGWRPPVLMVRVAQELARYWGLRLVGLHPTAHQLQGWSYRLSERHREAAVRIYESQGALWDHFDAVPGTQGWMVLPAESDTKLEATALSPDKRDRQIRRADYWLRTRGLLRHQFRQLLRHPARDQRVGSATASVDWDDSSDFRSSEDMVPSRVLETGPGSLL